jgi:TetR/AcrR family transcriptional regulator, regulator of mycofactocin system
MTGLDQTTAPRLRGRPPHTSAREIEVVAIALFTRQGFDATTVDQIAAAAGVSRRTFFRYFRSKAEVLWGQFDAEVTTIAALLEETADDLPLMDAVRDAVVAANSYRPQDIPELRVRMALINEVPELFATAAVHYERWEQAVAEFVARRRGVPAGDLHPLALARATLAACRAAYDVWMVRGDADLPTYLDRALRDLAAGFAGPA